MCHVPVTSDTTRGLSALLHQPSGVALSNLDGQEGEAANMSRVPQVEAPSRQIPNGENKRDCLQRWLGSEITAAEPWTYNTICFFSTAKCSLARRDYYDQKTLYIRRFSGASRPANLWLESVALHLRQCLPSIYLDTSLSHDDLLLTICNRTRAHEAGLMFKQSSELSDHRCVLHPSTYLGHRPD